VSKWECLVSVPKKVISRSRSIKRYVGDSYPIGRHRIQYVGISYRRLFKTGDRRAGVVVTELNLATEITKQLLAEICRFASRMAAGKWAAPTGGRRRKEGGTVQPSHFSYLL